MVDVSHNTCKNKRVTTTISALLWLLGLFAVVLLTVPFNPQMPNSGLDASWIYALNIAVANHLDFGRDLTFTFGPLGSVYSNVYFPETDHLTLVFSLWIAVGSVAGYWFLFRHRSVIPILLLGVALAITEVQDIRLMMLPLIAFACAYDITRRERIDWRDRIAILLILSAIGFLPLIKGSVSGVLIGLGALALVLLLVRKQYADFLLFIIVPVLSLLFAWHYCGQPIGGLPAFFINQKPIISGYTQAMSMHGSFAVLIRWLVSATLFFLLLIIGVNRLARFQRSILIIGAALFVFISFKAGFVRQDGHMLVTAPALFLLALTFSFLINQRYLLPLMLVALFSWATIRAEFRTIDPISTLQIMQGTVMNSVDGIKDRLNRGTLYRRYQQSKQAIRDENPLPPITGTVDAYPWELSPIFAYDLPWSGRPILQSYSVYTPALDHANAAHLLGNKAPDVLLWSVAPIDGRLATMEDAESWPIALTRYHPTCLSKNFVLLKRDNGIIKKVTYAPLQSGEGQVGQSIAVPRSAGPVVARISLDMTTFGKVVNTLFKLPPLFIVTESASGQVHRSRYVPEMGRTGFIVSPYIKRNIDFVTLASGTVKDPITSLRIETGNVRFWKKSFNVQFSSFDIPKTAFNKESCLQ